MEMPTVPPAASHADTSSPATPGPLDGAIGRTLASLIERDGGLLAVKDAATGAYMHVNAAMAQWLGRSTFDVVGRTDADLIDPALVPALRAAEQTAMASAAPVSSEHRFEWRDRRHDFQVLRLVASDANGRRLLCSVWIDRSPAREKDAQLRAALYQLEQEQRANRQLRHELQDQTLRDTSTGLYNRAHFDDQFRREVDLSTREHREFSLVSIALDLPQDQESGLDSAGQAAVLDALGRLLRGNTRAMDASCRLDERRFAVLLSGVGLSTAHARMECLRRECASQIVVIDGRECRFTVAMGVASFPHTAHGPDELLAACDAALAEAQRRGGNCIALASIRFDAAAG
jgi:diguanylate cyclase (GGDEF)-like protein